MEYFIRKNKKVYVLFSLMVVVIGPELPQTIIFIFLYQMPVKLIDFCPLFGYPSILYLLNSFKKYYEIKINIFLINRHMITNFLSFIYDNIINC